MREKLTRGGMALRREPASYECPFCLRPVGIIGNWLAKQKETDGLKLGSRLTVAGVEAVVAPVVDLQPIAEVADHYDGMFVEPDVPILAVGTARFRLNNARSIRAMLSAAGDKE